MTTFGILFSCQHKRNIPSPSFDSSWKIDETTLASIFDAYHINFVPKLITECLQRMKLSNKVLQGKEARTVVRLFGLQTRDQLHRDVPRLPEPSPAPDVESVWIKMNRPEYYFFTANEDLRNFFRFEGGSRSIDETTFKQAMRYISKDEYRRNRVYAMLEHMALWHTAGNEMRVASWLLWERAAMMNYTDKNSAIKAMESNILFQLMINKFFNGGTGPRKVPHFPNLDLYGEGMTNYIMYQDKLRESGTLKPNFIYSASIADRAFYRGCIRSKQCQ